MRVLLLQRARHLEQSLLPRARSDICEAAQNWTSSHPESPIRVNGMDPLTHIAALQTDYQKTKERDKLHKVHLSPSVLIGP